MIIYLLTKASIFGVKRSAVEQIFGDLFIANAILDRLLHHSRVINIVVRSYRTKDIIDDDK